MNQVHALNWAINPSLECHKYVVIYHYRWSVSHVTLLQMTPTSSDHINTNTVLCWMNVPLQIDTPIEFSAVNRVLSKSDFAAISIKRSTGWFWTSQCFLWWILLQPIMIITCFNPLPHGAARARVLWMHDVNNQWRLRHIAPRPGKGSLRIA